MPCQSNLTEREKEILALLSLGKSYQEIAQVTWLSLNTVKTHVKIIYAKAGVHNKVAAVQWYRDEYHPNG